MRTKVITEIVNNLKEKLSADQCEALKVVLHTVLDRYDITESVQSDADDSDKDYEALFVSSRKPYQRLTKAGIQNIFRNIGEKSGVEKVHPHRFRRTAATDLLRAGMPLEEVKEYLGHEKIDTTMIYCTVNQDNIKNSHQRYMSA